MCALWYGGIVHPARGRIPFVPYPYQADCMRAAANPRRIVLKARQIGFSQVFALEALYYAITEPETTILLVSRSQDLATNLLRYCYLSYNSLDDSAALSLAKANEGEMGFANGSRIKSIPANRSTGRGFAARRVYLDEFAYAAYDTDIYQSVAPTVSQGGYLTIGSTPNGVGNLFHQLFLSGDGFTRFAVPWHHCPAYWTPEEQVAGVPKGNAAWYRSERPKYTAQQWAAEFECDFVGSGDALYPAELLSTAEAGAQGETPPQAGRSYVTSVDVGRRQDATVINTFDITDRPYQRVAFERFERQPFPVIQSKIEARARRYPGPVYVESNGIGDPVIENLTVQARPFVTTAKTKWHALQTLLLLLESGDLKAQWDAQERRELTMYRIDDSALTQDCVMSLAIGAAVIKQLTTSVLWGFA